MSRAKLISCVAISIVIPPSASSRMTSSTSATSSGSRERKSTRLTSSNTEIYTLSLHDALPIYVAGEAHLVRRDQHRHPALGELADDLEHLGDELRVERAEEHTSDIQQHRDLHSFPTRRSSDLCRGRSSSRASRSASSSRPRRARG